MERGLPHPGDPTLSREARLSAVIREVMRSNDPAAHASPLETAEPDEIASLTPDEFFADMPAIDDRHG
jgi:hypothetical protein